MKANFRSYPPIANAFLRFLTSQAGENTSSGLAAQIKEIKSGLKEEVRAIKNQADGAHKKASFAETTVNTLIRLNKDLKSPK